MLTPNVTCPRFLIKSAPEHFCNHSQSCFPSISPPPTPLHERVLIERRPLTGLSWTCYLAETSPSVFRLSLFPSHSFCREVTAQQSPALSGFTPRFTCTSFPFVSVTCACMPECAWACLHLVSRVTPIMHLRGVLSRPLSSFVPQCFDQPKRFEPTGSNWSHVLQMREFQTLLDFSGTWQKVVRLWARAGPVWTAFQNIVGSEEGELAKKKHLPSNSPSSK